MMLLCGLATKKTPESSQSTSSFLQIGGNDPQYGEFKPRTVWSLSNAFTSAFKNLDAILRFRATAKLGGFFRSSLQAKLLRANEGLAAVRIDGPVSRRNARL